MKHPDHSKEALFQDLYIIRHEEPRSDYQWTICMGATALIPLQRFKSAGAVSLYTAERGLSFQDKSLFCETMKLGTAVALDGHFRQYSHHSYDIFFKEVAPASLSGTFVLDAGVFTTAYIVEPTEEDIEAGRRGRQVHLLDREMLYRPTFDYAATARIYL